MLLSRMTANEAAGRTKCVLSHAVPRLSKPTPALGELVELGSPELLVSEALLEVVLLSDDTVELELLLVVELLVPFELVDEVDEEDDAVLIELSENEMTVPRVAAASVVLDEVDETVEEEPEEEVDVGVELLCARTWVNRVAMHSSSVAAVVVATMRTI